MKINTRFALSRGIAAVGISLLALPAVVQADGMASLATGGYSTALRTPAVMHKMDTNGDGMVSKEEWLAFQEKVFAMLKKGPSGTVDAKSFAASGKDVAQFATGGYARGLLTHQMMSKIDTNGDGAVSHEEFIAYQTKIFDMMNTSVAHKDVLGPSEFFASGGIGRK